MVTEKQFGAILIMCDQMVENFVLQSYFKGLLLTVRVNQILMVLKIFVIGFRHIVLKTFYLSEI